MKARLLPRLLLAFAMFSWLGLAHAAMLPVAHGMADAVAMSSTWDRADFLAGGDGVVCADCDNTTGASHCCVVAVPIAAGFPAFQALSARHGRPSRPVFRNLALSPPQRPPQASTSMF